MFRRRPYLIAIDHAAGSSRAPAVSGKEISALKLLLDYLRGYWKLVVLALILATINQVFSLLDPAIFRHIVDRYAMRYKEYDAGEFARGVGFLLFLAVGVIGAVKSERQIHAASHGHCLIQPGG